MRETTIKELFDNGLMENEKIIIEQVMKPLYEKIKNGQIIQTGANASQAPGQESYVEILGKMLELDPMHPDIRIDDNFKPMKAYQKKELDWYLSEDLSIKGHDGIETNPTWNSCCSKDDEKLVNSNYGWCVFSEENGSQYDNALKVLTKDKTSRNALVIYTRPSIHTDMFTNGKHDMICTVFSQFFIRDNKLEMVHVMRSNDFKFGFMCSDWFWNCFVYQNMYADLKKVYPDLEVGKIHWCSTSLHLYARHYDILKEHFERVL